MAMIPLQASFRGDFVVQLVPVEDTDDMNTVAEKIARHAVGLRVAIQDVSKRVYFNGKELPPDMTVADSGIEVMDYVEAGYVG
ncbi:toluene-4-monooxygenase system B family protein [Labrys portucalensis]|uniref:Toluene-4-monooxygenase system B family protein n=1 Tax=Labrys neptuniae TaxID=376174 RepID=A0ABV6ZMT9_9HYPH